jgi:hypothetical protein
MLSIATVCKLKSKNILAIAGCALLPIAVGSLALAAQDRYTLKIPDGLAWSDFRGYETWQDVAVSQTETSLKVIAANDVIIDAYRDGVPATANFFPTAPRLPRSSGPSKRTLSLLIS